MSITELQLSLLKKQIDNDLREFGLGVFDNYVFPEREPYYHYIRYYLTRGENFLKSFIVPLKFTEKIQILNKIWWSTEEQQIKKEYMRLREILREFGWDLLDKNNSYNNYNTHTISDRSFVRIGELKKIKSGIIPLKIDKDIKNLNNRWKKNQEII